jgi:hypothetical protein
MRVYEVGILRDHHPFLAVSHVVDLFVGRPVTARKIECVHGVAPGSGQPNGHPPGQFRIHEDVHGATG